MSEDSLTDDGGAFLRPDEIEELRTLRKFFSGIRWALTPKDPGGRTGANMGIPEGEFRFTFDLVMSLIEREKSRRIQGSSRDERLASGVTIQSSDLLKIFGMGRKVRRAYLIELLDSGKIQ